MSKTDFDTKLRSFNQTFDSSYFISRSHFEEDGVQNCLLFQPMQKYLKTINSNSIYFKGLSDESVKARYAPNNFFDTSLHYCGSKIRVEFSESSLKQDKITYDHGKEVNIYTVYEISKSYDISSYPHWKIVYSEQLV